MENRGDKSRNVSDHTTTKADDKRLSIEAGGDHPITNGTGFIQVFRFLTRGNGDECWAIIGARQVLNGLGSENCGNASIGNNGTRFAREIFAHVFSELLQQAGADQHIVAVRTGSHFNRDHG